MIDFLKQFSWRRLSSAILQAFGTLWFAVEATAYFFSERTWANDIKSGWWIFLILGVVIGVYRARPKRSVQARISGTDVLVEVCICDLFKQPGALVIGSNSTFDTAIEDNTIVMSKAIDILTEVTNATRIVFVQKRDYEYDFNQTIMLSEIAVVFSKIVKQDLINYNNLTTPECRKCGPGWYAQLQYLTFTLMKQDPVGAYVELKRLHRREEIKLTKIVDSKCIPCEQKFIQVIKTLIVMLGQTKLVRSAEPFIAGYKVGDRSIYRRVFTATIKPDFMFTRLMASYPEDAEELDSYSVGGTEVTMFNVPDTIQTIYHMIPPEFRLTEEKYQILDMARKIMAEHKPKKSEFTDS